MSDTQELPFKLYAELDLRKSVESLTKSAEPVIYGRVLNNVEDTSGETPVLDMFDWSYFDKNGFAKFEHDTNDPSNYIGVPIKRIRKSKDEQMLACALFPSVKKAQDLMTLMKAIDEYNRSHPENPRTIGYSVEGGYVFKSKQSGKYAGKVVNVAISPNPVDATSYIELVRSENLKFAKSLAAGYATDPKAMDNGGALREQDLEGASRPAQPAHTNHERKEQTMFASYAEAYRHFKSEGKSDAEAKAAAEAAMKAKSDRADASVADVEKSLTAIKTYLQKSIDAVKKHIEKQDTATGELSEYTQSLKKTLNGLKTGENVDAQDFVAGQTGAMSAIADTVTDPSLPQALSGLAEAFGEIAGMVKSLTSLVADNAADTRKIGDNLGTLAVRLSKSQVGIRTQGLNGFQTQDNGEGLTDEAKLMKSITPKAAERYFTDKAIELVDSDPTKSSEYFRAQEQVASYGVASLSKSLQAELKEQFVKKG